MREKRALIIGLGGTSTTYLEAIVDHYQAEGAQSTARTLWIGAPHQSPPDDDSISCYTLTMDDNTLSHLYYRDEHVRAWSSANWWHWKDQLPDARLGGKLAMYANHSELDAWLSSQLDQLYAGEEMRLVVYLIASLYEPFSSGALLDTAYLLHKLVRLRGGRVYGFLLLPGIVESETSTVETEGLSLKRQLDGANTYAALREIQFLQMRPSFYHAHPGLYRSVQGKSNVSRAGLLIDQPPFLSGDCFLIGGDSGGDPEIGFQTLTRENVQVALKQFIHLHSTTSLGDQLPRSDPFEGYFSSFGILSQEASFRDEDENPSRREYHRQLVLRALAAGRDSPVALLPEVQSTLDRAENPDVDLALINRDAVQAALSQPFLAEAQRSDISVGRLLALAEFQNKAFVDRINQLKEEIEQARRPLEVAKETQASSKKLLQYLNTVDAVRYWFWLLPIWISGILLFAVLGSFVPFIFWLVVGLAPSTLGLVFYRRIKFNAEREYEQAKAEAVRLKRDQDRREKAVERLTDLKPFVALAFRLERLKHAFEWANKQQPLRPDDNQYEMLNDRVRESIISEMVAWTMQTSGDEFDTHLNTILRAYYAEQRRSQEFHFFAKELARMKQRTLVTLGLGTSGLKQLSEHLVALLPTHLSNRQRVRRDVDPITGTQMVFLPPSQGQSRKRHYIRLRTNIRLRSLISVRDWRGHYYATISRHEGDRNVLYRSWLHPTRDGVATPDLEYDQRTLSIMLWTALSHLSMEYDDTKAEAYELARQLGVPQRTKTEINYDELSGALQENPDALVQRVSLTKSSVEPDTTLVDYLLRVQPRTSEHFAAWEIWVYEMILDSFSRLEDNHPELRQMLQGQTHAFYRRFTQPYSYYRQT